MSNSSSPPSLPPPPPAPTFWDCFMARLPLWFGRCVAIVIVLMLVGGCTAVGCMKSRDKKVVPQTAPLPSEPSPHLIGTETVTTSAWSEASKVVYIDRTNMVEVVKWKTNEIQVPGPIVTNVVQVPGETVVKFMTNNVTTEKTVYLAPPDNKSGRLTTVSSNALANINGDVYPGAIVAIGGNDVTVGYPPDYLAKLAERALAQIPTFQTSAKVQPVKPGQEGVVLNKDQYASIEFPGDIGNFQIKADRSAVDITYDGLTEDEAAGRAGGIESTRRVMVRALKPSTKVAFIW